MFIISIYLFSEIFPGVFFCTRAHSPVWPPLHLYIVCHLFAFVCPVKAAVLEFPDVTGIEGEPATLRCRAIGDPAPQMTIRKTSETDHYQLGSSVS